jgi:protein TonB
VACPYPEELRATGAPGEVLVRALITREGVPTNFEVLKASHALFAESALKTLPQWRFKPAMRNGEPIEVTFVITVTFSVRH